MFSIRKEKTMKHSIKYFKIIFPCIIVLTLFGCATIEDTLYLREAEVSGPIMPAPIHLTDSMDTPSFTISPRFSYNTKSNFTGDIEQYSSYYSLDTTFVPSENSLTWDIASFSAGVDMDFAVSKVIALTFGVSYSSQSNFSAWGGNFGIGFNTYNSGTAFRIDVGIQINSMQYDAYTLVHRVETGYLGGGNESVFFYHDVGSSTHYDPYFNLTFNTAYRSWPVNIFINAGYVVQTLFSFEPTTTYSYNGITNIQYINTDLRGTTTAGFINLTPGVFFYLNNQTRFLLGSRFYIETQIGDAEPQIFIMPMMQVDFTL
jgi:hypothetical protein